MFVKVLKDINFPTLSHKRDCIEGDIVEIDNKHKNKVLSFSDKLEVLPNYVIPTLSGSIDRVVFKKGEMVELPLSTYMTAVGIYPNRFKKLTLEEYKNIGKEVKTEEVVEEIVETKENEVKKPKNKKKVKK